jgi:hypothetical protein
MVRFKERNESTVAWGTVFFFVDVDFHVAGQAGKGAQSL